MYAVFYLTIHLIYQQRVGLYEVEKKDLFSLNCLIHFRINEHTHNFRYKKPQSRGSFRRAVRIWVFPEADVCSILEMWAFRKHPLAFRKSPTNCESLSQSI